jgi:hypothetical protein
MAVFCKALESLAVLSELTFSGDWASSEPVTLNATATTEANFSGKDLVSSGAAVLQAFLPKCQ